MASLFATRLRCFYCGKKSSPPTKGNIQQWKCSQCQAVNYLDEKGEITDPPVADSSPGPAQPKYALPLPRSDSDLLQPSSSQSSLFCSTCLKNQHLYTQTLASYLPPPSHPDYAKYEASYPAYRESLEERYPQVCKNCEPRVRERIRQARYVAKADNLRRTLERSKNGRFHKNKNIFGWRSLVVYSGAVAFWASITGQLIWDIASFMSAENLSSGLGLDLPIEESIIKSCISQALEHSQMSVECGTTAQAYAGVSLLLGALGVWWNPKLRHKVNGKTGRLTGLHGYYQIQIVVLAVRFVAWTFLQDFSITDLNPHIVPAIHVLVAIVTVVSVIVSRLTIKFDTTPLVNWQDYDEPLVPEPLSKPSTGFHNFPDSQKPTSNFHMQSGTQAFPIGKLAVPQQSKEQNYAPPTPPDDTTNDVDEMDWVPSQQPFEPKANARSLLNRYSASPSVFQGRLPSAPQPPSWQLRIRKPEPSPIAVEKKPNPFHNALVLQPTLNSIDEVQHSSSREMVMAPPKFFPPSDRAVDTGLESLFDRTFSLADEPRELNGSPRTSRHERDIPPRPLTTNPGQKTSHILKSALLLVTMTMLSATKFFSIPRNTVETIVLAVCFIISGFSLLESLMKPLAYWGVLDFLLPVVELLSCTYLTILSTQGLIDQILFDRAAQGLTAFMLVQELMILRPMVSGGQSTTPSGSESNSQPVEQPKMTTTQVTGSQQTLGSLSLREPSPSRPTNQALASTVHNQNSFSGNSNLANQRSPAPIGNRPSTRSGMQPSFTNNRPLVSPRPQFNSTGVQSSFGAGNSFNNSQQTMPYPPPFNSFSRPTEGPPLSFSSFSSLNEKVLSTNSIASTTDYASSTTSEAPSPQLRARQQTPHSTASGRFGSPSITGLTLDDSPMRPAQSRYSLRNRQR